MLQISRTNDNNYPIIHLISIFLRVYHVSYKFPNNSKKFDVEHSRNERNKPALLRMSLFAMINVKHSFLFLDEINKYSRMRSISFYFAGCVATVGKQELGSYKVNADNKERVSYPSSLPDLLCQIMFHCLLDGLAT